MELLAASPLIPSLFITFAETAEAASETSKRLAKAALLAAYFSELSDDDLARAARYLAGHVFPLRDQRTTNVGGAAMLGAIEEVTGAAPETLRENLVRLGDLGDVAREAFAASQGAAQTPTLTLVSVGDALETLASTSGAKRKRELVVALLRPATALEAKYLVKLLAGDLRIGLQEGAIEDAIARWRGMDVAAVQWANMLTGDLGETAILARAGRLDSVSMRLFHPLKFMLATPAADLDDVARQMPEAFVVEDKFDGIRAQAHIARETPNVPEGVEEAPPALHGVVRDGVRVALFSRTLDEITESFPDLVAPLAKLAEGSPQGLILDGEIVPTQGDQILPFQELQKRLGRKTLSDAMRAEVPVCFVAYDALFGDEQILINDPFARRRAVLETAVPDSGPVRRAASVQFRDAALLDEEFDAARGRGNEGLMVKDPASLYKPGRRGREWLKIKRALATLDVVVTSVEVGNGGRRHLLSDYTFAVRASETDPALLNIGKAYSGLTDAELQELSEWFRAHTIQEFAHGKVRVVEPKVVIEIAFDRVQASARHKSGYALRFPRILRIRDDKPVTQIDTLETVRKLAGE
ncbi:DNA ligase [Capsulimonas corticalis]|uniref:DNA ligase (ATP) n=1 Tax=Capsulimonas corticalis TaxID=2219043 RepID=A0A402D1W7_9BACT|nr:ATP-dependent DNA ligase [Capsulimonas corticalis]BDI28713.1 DNA ligase [Capsulimonas corticalis]